MTLKKPRSTISQLSFGLRRSYNTNFKLRVINHAEATNICEVGRKFGLTKGSIHRWRHIKDKLGNANSS
jgi:transposase-like protein